MSLLHKPRKVIPDVFNRESIPWKFKNFWISAFAEMTAKVGGKQFVQQAPMPRVFDNIDQSLLSALQQTLEATDRAGFCVGYFNLRGLKQLDSYVEKWSGGEGIAAAF